MHPRDESNRGGRQSKRRARLRSVGLAGLLGLALLGGPLGCRLSPKAVPATEQALITPFVAESTLGRLDSAAALAQGPLVLIFYRGHW